MALGANLGIEMEHLAGLEKAPKATLKYLDLATGTERTTDWRKGTIWERD